MLITILSIYTIYFTYSTYFGASLYSFLVLLKIFVICIEFGCNTILDEELLVSPLGCYMCKILKIKSCLFSLLALIMMLTTYGAENFLSFLNSYLIDTGKIPNLYFSK